MAVALTSALTLPADHFADRTRHKIAVRLLPFLFILYIVNYVDRTNLAYAALGMSRELRFSDQVFGLGAGIFFVSYVAFQVPGALLVERWSARRMIALTMIAWGSLTILTALVQTPLQLYSARFVLGAAEAGFFPGVVVYLSHWFSRQDRAKAMSNFMGAVPLSSALGSPLAGWILGRSWHQISGWRWLFIVEGVPAILLGVVAFFFLTDWPREAAWLDHEQREWLEKKLECSTPPTRGKATFWQVLRSPTVILLAIIPFFSYLVFYSFAFWLPTLLKRQTGASDLRIGLLGSIPFVVYALAMQFDGWHSDRRGERRWHVAVPLFISAGALLFTLRHTASMAELVIVFSVVGLGGCYLPIFWAIPTEILSESMSATAVGIINSVGSIAGFAGPYAFGYLYSRTGSFSAGLAVMMVAALIAGLLVLRIPAEQRDRCEAELPVED